MREQSSESRQPRSAPRVSILMAVYNGERYLCDSVQSLLDQTFADFELIIVDDGSTDDTPTLLRELGDPRVVHLRNDRNIGLARSLNRAIGTARGELVARHDADDVACPDRLQVQVNFLDRHPAVAFVGGGIERIGPAGEPLSPASGTESDPNWLRWRLLFSNPFAHASVMWRREQVSLVVGGYDPEIGYGQDYDFWVRIADRLEIGCVSQVVARIREHPGAVTAVRRAEQDATVARVSCSQLRKWLPECEPQVLEAVHAIGRQDGEGLSPEMLERGCASLVLLRQRYVSALRLGGTRSDRFIRSDLEYRLGQVALRCRREGWGGTGRKILFRYVRSRPGRLRVFLRSQISAVGGSAGSPGAGLME